LNGWGSSDGILKIVGWVLIAFNENVIVYLIFGNRIKYITHS
jgi:hypothetical protein